MLFKDVRELLLGPYQSTNMLISILLYFVFFGLNNTLQGILRAQSKISKLVKYRIFFAIVEAVLLLLLILNNSKVFNYSYILIMVFCQILYFILLTRQYRDFWKITYTSLKFSKETIIFFKYSLSIIPVTLIGWITSSSDRFFITDYFGSESSGYYSAIAQYTGYMTLIVFPFTFVYFKDFSKFYDYDFSKFKHLFIKSFLICMSMSVLYFIFFYLFKDFIFFNYLGLDYRPEFNKLVICFLFCFFLINIASFLSVYMLVSKQIKVMFIAISIGAIINFSLNKFFLQNYSYTNSAYYWVLSVGVQILILSVFTYKSIRTK